MDWETRIIFIVVIAIGGAIIKAIGYVIGSPAERAARELRETHQRALVRQAVQRSAEDVASASERRAAELIAEFPKLGDYEIATLMHDELTNMRSPHRAYYDWATPANVARVRRTMAVNAIRAQRSAGEDIDVDT